MPEVSKTTIDEAKYGQSMVPRPEDVLSGDPATQVHWVHRTDAPGQPAVGIWIVEPSTFKLSFPGHETVHVLEGALDVVLADGATVELRPGDVATFPAGQESIWTVSERLKKVFVVTPASA